MSTACPGDSENGHTDNRERAIIKKWDSGMATSFRRIFANFLSAFGVWLAGTQSDQPGYQMD